MIIGHNQTVGWGFTNLGPDVTDLYLEKVVGDTYLVGTTTKPITKRTEVIKVAGGDDVTVTVRETEHGPLVSDASDELTTVGKDAPAGAVAPPKGDGYAVALRWTALTPSRTADAINDLDVAQSWDRVPQGGLGVHRARAEHDLRVDRRHDRLPDARARSRSVRATTARTRRTAGTRRRPGPATSRSRRCPT